ncbi:MAG: hypothetical protein AMJ69_05190 [Gammaproteobacteria bacterium SG8_47]|nr:MAG: hypothetical protein AMJ69_05190 [Gammaproteobacteria bacterium SG8_47]
MAPTVPALAAEPIGPATEQPIFEPQVERRDVAVDKIDTEDFEVGLFFGVMSIEDFGSNSVYALRFAYHITEGLFAELGAGMSQGGKTSYENLSQGLPLLSDEERELFYYDLSLGYNLFPGESFIGGKAFNTALYLIGGVGNTKFAGDERFTINFGAGYRFIATDWLALHGAVRDYLFNIDVTGEDKLTNNIQLTLGATVFF